jgi:hypothetical protein
MKQDSTLLLNKINLCSKIKQIRYSSVQVKVLLILPLLLMVFFLGAGSVEAATLFCGAAATGNGSGSDWNNQADFDVLTYSRGNTYYLADGSYPSKTFSTAASGTTYITIKKATGADHGTDVGWLSSYGDGQAVFSGRIYFGSSYWIFDGNDTSGYGMVINVSGAIRGVEIQTTASYITVKSTSVDLTSASQDAVGFYLKQGSNILLSNVESHHSQDDCIKLIDVSDTIMEYFYCHDRRFGGGVHGDAFEIWGTSNITLRYSRVDWDGQQVYFGGLTYPVTGRWDIYGNVFSGGSTSGKGVHPDSTNPTVGPLYIYNNTFEGLNIGMDLNGNCSGYVKNNIFFNVNNSIGFGATSHSYNYFETGLSTAGDANSQSGGNPFVNISGKNYHLSAALNAGDSAIGAVYKADPDGNLRSADGVWDRGAYEYVSGGGGGPTTHTVTPSAGPNGSISPNTPQTVNDGTTRQFTVTPNAGYSASVGGTCGGSLVGTTYTTNAITADCTVSATFTLNSAIRPSPPPAVWVQ